MFFIPPLLFPLPVHFFTYSREFIIQYCQVSALLELESLLSQQSLREAFSDAELATAKQRHQQVQDYIQVRGGRRLNSAPDLPGLRQQHLHPGCSLVLVALGDFSDVADG